MGAQQSHGAPARQPPDRQPPRQVSIGSALKVGGLAIAIVHTIVFPALDVWLVVLGAKASVSYEPSLTALALAGAMMGLARARDADRRRRP